MVKVGVLGATGQVGVIFCRSALEEGHQVSILVRSPDKVASVFKGVENRFAAVIPGESTDEAAVKKLASSVDVLVSLVGSPPHQKPEDCIMEKTAANMIAATKKGQRIFFCSSLGMGGTAPSIKFLLRIFAGAANVENYEAADDLLMSATEQGGVSVCVMRPAALGDDGETGEYLASKDGSFAMSQLARSDLSQFIIDHLENTEWDNQAVHIYKKAASCFS